MDNRHGGGLRRGGCGLRRRSTDRVDISAIRCLLRHLRTASEDPESQRHSGSVVLTECHDRLRYDSCGYRWLRPLNRGVRRRTCLLRDPLQRQLYSMGSRRIRCRPKTGSSATQLDGDRSYRFGTDCPLNTPNCVLDPHVAICAKNPGNQIQASCWEDGVDSEQLDQTIRASAQRTVPPLPDRLQ